MKTKRMEDERLKRAANRLSFVIAIPLLLVSACTNESASTPPYTPNIPVATDGAALPITPSEASVYALDSSFPVNASEAAVAAPDSSLPIVVPEAAVAAPDSSLPIVVPEAAVAAPDTSTPAADASTMQDATQQHPESGVVESDCLSCHGPFAVLQEASRDYVTPQGIAVNPHRTLDTQNTTGITDNPHRPGADAIECEICHQPFPMPPPSADAVPEADITLCYECHHEQVFSPSCVECHEASGI